MPFANGLASMRVGDYSWEYYLPGSFDAVARYLHEYVGLVYYRWVY
jgi:hypothetical protein